MPNNFYEIEIKSLLGNKENADGLVRKMKAGDPNFQILGAHRQLNHYFIGGDLKQLHDNAAGLIDTAKKESLKDLADKAKDYSVRTRWADGKVILVIKASVDDTTSSNGTARLEWENLMNLKLDELDKLILDSGFNYQAKWSRERQEFRYKDLNVSIDKNAGYGYLAEFEKVVGDESLATQTKQEIRQLMKELGAEELPQDRLARMFDYYNNNWQDYYGTDNIFTIE